jgi:predicted MPP superfamily phosphohydrolase
MRILHVSDLHAPATVPSDQRQIVEALLRDVEAEERRRAFDLVVFSGDLTSDGSRAAFISARELLLDPIASLLAGRPVILTAGNHDVDRTAIKPILESGLQQQLTDNDAVDALLGDKDTLAQACQRLTGWETFQGEWYDGNGPTAVGALASVQTFTADRCSVGVAVLNSAWRASGGEADHGRLIVAEQGTRETLSAIDDCEIRLVVMHHPFSWLAEFAALANRTLLESHGVFVFTGHEHVPDPATEITTRGAALYSRAGCLYAGGTFSNSYTIVELEPASHNATVMVRSWWPKRGEFDQATDLHRGGKLELPWPTRANALPTHRTSVAKVLAPLAEIAQEQSLIAGDLALSANATVTDLLIAPRFWPVPNKEAIDTAVPRDSRPKPVDALDALQHARVLIVSGEHSSGVTSSLLWMLEQHFRLYGTALPAYAVADERFSLGRLKHAIVNAQTPLGGTNTESMPLILAVDEVKLSDRRSQARLVRFINENPHVTVVIGCHEEEHAVAAQALEAHRITYERVFLAPFGRREMRQLVARIAGPNSSDLVQRVLSVIHGQGLARNPLNVAALVAVVTREEDLTELNESGLLQSYVTILLENPVAVDPEGLAMDYRRREHFLSQFAAHLVRINRSRLGRRETEQFVLGYYERLGWASASASQLLDSLIRRRVLSQTDAGVGFRYPALLYLFAGKAAIEDE